MRVGIVGAGIMGCLLALRFHNEGWHVTLFDENPMTDTGLNCSAAAAGLLAPISELDKADFMIFRLGMESLDTYWPAIFRQLTTPFYFQRNGCLVLHHPQDLAEWQQFNARISKHLGDAFYHKLTQEKLIELEPELAKFSSAYYLEQEAHLDSQGVLNALRYHFREQGITLHAETHINFLQPGHLIAQGQSQVFDMVFDCRGLGAKSTFPKLRGIRGELIWLHAPEVNLQRPVRLLHPRYHLYVVPRPHHHYLIGASELETEDCGPISVRTTLELLTAAYYLHAGFSEARIIKTVTHTRPTLPHHQPRIQFTERYIAVNGLYRHGYLIAPALAEEVVRGLKKQQRHYPELWENYHDQHLLK